MKYTPNINLLKYVDTVFGKKNEKEHILSQIMRVPQVTDNG